MVSQSIPTVGRLTAQTVYGVDANRRNMGHRSHDQAFEQALAKAVERGFVAAFRWLGNRDSAHDACQEAAARHSRPETDTTRTNRCTRGSTESCATIAWTAAVGNGVMATARL